MQLGEEEGDHEYRWVDTLESPMEVRVSRFL